MARKHKRVKKRPRKSLPSTFRCPECRKPTLHVTTQNLLSCIKAVFNCGFGECSHQSQMIINGHWAHAVDFYSYLVDHLNGDGVPTFVQVDFLLLSKLLKGDEDLNIAELEHQTGLTSRTIYRRARKDGWSVKDGYSKTFYLTKAPEKIRRARRSKAKPIDLSLTDLVYFCTSEVHYSASHKTLTIHVEDEAYLLGKRKLLRRFLRRVKLDPKKWLKVEPEELEEALKGVAPKSFKLQVHDGMILSIKVAKDEETKRKASDKVEARARPRLP